MFQLAQHSARRLRSQGPELLLNAVVVEEGLLPPGTAAIDGSVLSSELLLSIGPHLHSANLKTKRTLKPESRDQTQLGSTHDYYTKQKLSKF